VDATVDRLVLFLVASLVLIAAPGPDNLLVLTRGVTLGRRSALVSAAGAATGLVGHSFVAAAGLSALLAQSATAYAAVKYVGAAYLLYLGIQAVRDEKSFHRDRFHRPAEQLRHGRMLVELHSGDGESGVALVQESGTLTVRTAVSQSGPGRVRRGRRGRLTESGISH
jgi:LysE type translocator